MATDNVRNKFDNSDSLELGINGENHFEATAHKEGWLVFPATKADNMKGHIDYTIKKNIDVYDVDIKGLKRISRGDSNVQDDKIWIEFKNVVGNNGWLYGRAELIAFETIDSFKIVKRAHLITLVDRLVDKTEKVDRAYKALYKVYSRTRSGRADEITMIKTSDLNQIVFMEWKK